MNYFTVIENLAKNIPTKLVDFQLERNQLRTPTQASSNFITNKEQGDWAENLILRAINETSTNFIAVKYGKSDDLIAGEDGFDDFYQDFQHELDTIGKRPDLLIKIFNMNLILLENVLIYLSSKKMILISSWDLI